MSDYGGWSLRQAAKQEGEDASIQLEQWQWKMLGDSLDRLYHNRVISDYTWAEKAYKAN